MTHEQLVEKVARAIWDVCGFVHGSEDRMFEPLAYGEEGEYAPVQAECQRAARAALAVVYEAMREPDEETLGPGIYSAADVMLASQWVNGPDASVVLALAQWAFSAGYTATIAASPLNPEVK